MAFRKQGTLIPLERRVLEVGVRRGRKGMYGFALAQELADAAGETRLASHGTLYKALDRLRKAGLLDAEWEDPSLAVEQARPRRRIYRITAAGKAALAHTAADAPEQSTLRTGEAQA